MDNKQPAATFKVRFLINFFFIKLFNFLKKKFGQKDGYYPPNPAVFVSFNLNEASAIKDK